MSLERRARFDPFRPLHWRWDLAQQVARGEIAKPGPMTLRLKSVVGYLRRRAAGQRLEKEEDSRITAALELYESDTPFRWELEARILAGESDEEISQKMGVPAETTATFEWLFFAVRHCRRATGFLLGAAVKYAHFRGFRDHELREFWAWAAMAGRSQIVDLLVRQFHAARREDEPPDLIVYLRRGACDLMLQTFIALQVVPPEADARWCFNLSVKLQLAEVSEKPVANTNRIYRALIRCARQFLETGKVPDPPDWWTSTNAFPAEAGSEASPTRKTSTGKQPSATPRNQNRQAEEPIGS